MNRGCNDLSEGNLHWRHYDSLDNRQLLEYIQYIQYICKGLLSVSIQAVWPVMSLTQNNLIPVSMIHCLTNQPTNQPTNQIFPFK